MQKKKDIEEQENQKPVALYSDTGFVPKIDKHSKVLTGDRENNEPEDVYKNLYKDAEYWADKKKTMMQERLKKIKEDEVKEVTFHPNITHDKNVSIPRYVDPKLYLQNRDAMTNYSDLYKQGRIRTSRSTNVLQRRLLHNSVSDRRLIKGCFSIMNLNNQAQLSRNLSSEFDLVQSQSGKLLIINNSCSRS